jgi:hypothetical protein
MIATAAESNPSCFAASPLRDVEITLMPSYLRLVRRDLIALNEASNATLVGAPFE